MSVRRFDGYDVDESEDGDYVRFEDFERMRKALQLVVDILDVPIVPHEWAHLVRTEARRALYAPPWAPPPAPPRDPDKEDPLYKFLAGAKWTEEMRRAIQDANNRFLTECLGKIPAIYNRIQVRSPPQESRMDEQQVETAVRERGLNAARVTAQQVDAAIVSEAYHVFDGKVTVCCLTLKNGFTVIGESAVVSPANFDAEIGERLSRRNARDKIWPLLGYALTEQMRGASEENTHEG